MTAATGRRETSIILRGGIRRRRGAVGAFPGHGGREGNGAAAEPTPVYPNWFIDRLADLPTAQALGRARP
jgi:hypothetical protein